jgi:ubiquinone/menaquinone biosynthesis C-methylase UbiE
MKDNFSAQAGLYAQFRPDYPGGVIDFLLKETPRQQAAWDCGTGNGQLAVKLAAHFEQVFATDMSAAQISKAAPRQNIVYKAEPAEYTAFADRQFDLITVAQAIHWFDFEAFYKEVYRTLKDDGLFAVVGYSLLYLTPEIDAVVEHFYKNITDPYWDKERRYVDELYRTIPFPFEEVPAPKLEQTYQWTIEQLTGYLRTWSAVQHYRKAHNGADPLLLIEADLRKSWGAAATHTVTWPIILRAGRKKSF